MDLLNTEAIDTGEIKGFTQEDIALTGFIEPVKKAFNQYFVTDHSFSADNNEAEAYLKRAGELSTADKANAPYYDAWARLPASRRKQVLQDIDNGKISYQDGKVSLPMDSATFRFGQSKDLEKAVLGYFKTQEKSPVKEKDFLATINAKTKQKYIEMEKDLDRYEGVSSMVGKIIGGMGAAMTEPINIATLPLGGTSVAKTAVGRIFQVAGKEALINALSESALQPSIIDYKNQIGLDYGAKEVFTNIAFAGAGGAVLGGGIRAVGEGVTKYKGMPELTERIKLAEAEKRSSEEIIGTRLTAEEHTEALKETVQKVEEGAHPTIEIPKIDRKLMPFEDAKTQVLQIAETYQKPKGKSLSQKVDNIKDTFAERVGQDMSEDEYNLAMRQAMSRADTEDIFEPTLTKPEIKKIREGKATPELLAKLENDVDNFREWDARTRPFIDRRADLETQLKTVTDAQQTSAILGLVDARAKKLGMDSQSFLEKYPLKIEDFTNMSGKAYDESDALFQAAYHGTPHIVDKFSTEKIGTGEGAQAYGYGLYFTESKDVAEHYRKKISNPELLIDGKKTSELIRQDGKYNPIFSHVDIFHNDGLNKAEILAKLEKNRLSEKAKGNRYFTDEQYQEVIETIKNSKTLERESKGAVYKVELQPKEKEYLLWDKPLSEQSSFVKQKLKTITLSDEGLSGKTKFLIGQFNKGELEQIMPRELLQALGKGDYESKEATQALLQYGIRGIKYLDGMSRGQNEGGFNYVIFRDEDVKIIERLAQQNDTINAMIIFGKVNEADAQAIVKVFESADVSTIPHELWHYFERTMDDMERSKVRDVFGKDYSEWTPKEKEYFAEAGVKYLSEGIAPTQALKEIFDSFKQWLKDLWEIFVHTKEEGAELTDKQRDFYAMLLGDKEAAQRLYNRDLKDPYNSQELPTDKKVQEDFTISEAEMKAEIDNAPEALADEFAMMDSEVEILNMIARKQECL